MEDIQLITYIIFAVLYLVFKFMQKKKDPAQDQDEAAQQPRRPQQPAKSFEELLREFSGEPMEEEKRVEEKPVRQPMTIKTEKRPEPPKYFSYETEYDEQAQKTYRESVERGQKAQTLDQQVDLENLKVRKIQVLDEEEEKERSVAQDYLEAFKTQEGAKKALIYSEIFNRKYF